jgi:hypothetical protein
MKQSSIARGNAAAFALFFALTSSFAHSSPTNRKPAGTVGNESPPNLFLYAIPQASDPHYLASWLVRIDQTSIQQPVQTVTVNLPDRAPLVAALDYWEPRAGYIDDPENPNQQIPDPNAPPSEFSWYWYGGQAEGVTVSLTMEAGYLAGRIWGPVHYQLDPVEPGEGRALLFIDKPQVIDPGGASSAEPVPALSTTVMSLLATTLLLAGLSSVVREKRNYTWLVFPKASSSRDGSVNATAAAARSSPSHGHMPLVIQAAHGQIDGGSRHSARLVGRHEDRHVRHLSE